MKKKIAQSLSLLIGIAMFFSVIKLAGFEEIVGQISNISPVYFFLFVAMALATTHWAAAYRWKYVLLGEGVNIPIWTLFKYKAMIFSLNYLTPIARVGGEPFKILLLKRQKVKASKSFASVIVDNFLGMSTDILLAGIILIVLFLTAARLSSGMRGLFLVAGLAFPLLVILVYVSLCRKQGAISPIFRVIGRLTGAANTRKFRSLCITVAKSEFYMRKLLVKKPRSMFFAAIYAIMSWPLTIIQYKLALLALGFDASMLQIIVSIIMVNVSLLIPIPAAIGVQEAAQLPVFQLLSGNPYMGVALSLMLRFKDAIFLLISAVLISKEGSSLFALLNRKKPE